MDYKIKHKQNGGLTYIKVLLVIVNVSLIILLLVFSTMYSAKIKTSQNESAIDSFKMTIESMKKVSDNYLRMELECVRDWAQYIDNSDMTEEEALRYINTANSQDNIYAHIVDLETMEAVSSYKNGTTEIGCYRKFADEDNETNRIFLENMRQMVSSQGEDVYVLGKYRTDDTQLNVISVGCRVVLKTAEGAHKEYLLLRVVPVETIRNVWVFPVEYTGAEVGLITQSGAYVVQSKSMKSLSFIDFIRAYNFENNYNLADEIVDRLKTTDNGLMVYKNSKGEDCYWYYSSFGDKSGLDILGYIPVNVLAGGSIDWTVVFVICGGLIILICIDYSYILHINKKLRETAQIAENASNAKTRFLSTMSHDIRTPMNGIIGMTNIAKGHINEPEYIEECLGKISVASDHLLTLINDILDISKVESGSMVFNNAPFSIEQSIDKVCNIIRSQADGKNITLELNKDIEKRYVVADELRLEQIFINLLSNAVKYTPDNGHIKVELTDRIENDKVELTYIVADTGVGMSEEFQKSMYNIFSREYDSRVDKIQGSGLGLSIVKQLVELMNGTVTCDSKLGIGTTFTVKLTLESCRECPTEGSNENQLKSKNQKDDFAGMKILVAEDNELNWEIINELLSEYKVDVTRAENGQRCVELLNESADNYYNLVLMDVQMPVMNGKEATRAIRRSDREYIRNITVIAMTADAFAEDVKECLDSGMNGHISKPVDMKKVVEVLRNVKKG